MTHEILAPVGVVTFPDIDPISLDQRYDGYFMQPTLRFRPIAFLTAYDSSSRRLCSWLEELGSVVMIVTDRNIPTEWISNRDGKLECLVIDESYTGSDLADCIASRFKAVAPAIPIIRLIPSDLASPFRTVDTSSDLSEISIRLPVSGTELKLAVLRAISGISSEEIYGHYPHCFVAPPVPKSNDLGFSRFRKTLCSLIGGRK
jgi:hypothetical protein